jgi:hypothetical protein
VLSLGAALLGLGQLGDVAANVGTQLLTLKFSREDEIDADLVGLELAARAGFNPDASIRLWEKMGQAKGGGGGGPAFLLTHPTGPDRIKRLQENVPKVRGCTSRRGTGLGNLLPADPHHVAASPWIRSSPRFSRDDSIAGQRRASARSGCGTPLQAAVDDGHRAVGAHCEFSHQQALVAAIETAAGSMLSGTQPGLVKTAPAVD